MSLTGVLYTSFAGIRHAEVEISVASANIANADKTGYSRKEYNTEYSLTTLGNVPAGGTIGSVALDAYLLEGVVEDTSAAAQSGVIADYLARYADALGSTDGGSTISAALDDLAASLDQLSLTPDDSALKSQVISDAENLAAQIRSLSDSVQDLRHQVNLEMAQTVDEINTALQAIDTLNSEIVVKGANGLSTADLVDERNVALQELSELIDIEYYSDSEGRIGVYSGNRPLIAGANVNELEYDATTLINGSMVYPATLPGVTVAGADITQNITGGKLGGLIELRDGTLVEEQEKLDAFSNALMDVMNTLSNQGTSIPPRSEMVGDVEGLVGTDAFTATGNVRIAVTDQNGVVSNFADIDLTAFATVDALITGINAALGGDATASLTTDGQLQIVSNVADSGISINELDSSVGADSDGFSMYFGLNNIFTGTGGEDIQVSDYLKDNPAHLATSRLSDDVALVSGDTGVYPGDATLVKEMDNAFTDNYSFAAAGNFAAQSQSLDVYADLILSNAASKAANAAENSETLSFFLEQTTSELQNLIGVNVDEELTHIVELEAKYQAAATLVGKVQEMFDELIAAVR